jgi:ABC-type multidrug transport system fused ATPase/permease subunit
VKALVKVRDDAALVISHRSSTLALCERRIEIEGGRLLSPA